MSQNVDEQEEYELAEKEKVKDFKFQEEKKSESKDLNNNCPQEKTSLILETDKIERVNDEDLSQRPVGHKLNKKSKIQKKIRKLASRAKLVTN